MNEVRQGVVHMLVLETKNLITGKGGKRGYIFTNADRRLHSGGNTLKFSNCFLLFSEVERLSTESHGKRNIGDFERGININYLCANKSILEKYKLPFLVSVKSPQAVSVYEFKVRPRNRLWVLLQLHLVTQRQTLNR